MFSRYIFKSLHSSWLIAIFATGILFGAVCARFAFDVVTLSGGWVLVSLLLFIFCLWRQKVYCVFFIAIAGGLLGYVRGVNMIAAQAPIYAFYNKTVVVSGDIVEDVTSKNGSDRMIITSLRINEQPIAGKMWVSIRHSDSVDLKRSDMITFRGELEPGFATFVGTVMNGTFVSAERVIHGDIALEARDTFDRATSEVISHPEVDLGLGFVVGEKSSLPDDLLTAMQIVGLTHIIVASGYNLTILVRLARRFLAKVSKFSALAGSAGLVLSFIMITGMSPSMSRAGIVTGLSLVAWYYGRSVHPVVLLLMSGAITVLIDPSSVWGDAGWLLSFSAFAGVLIAAPLFHSYFFGDSEPGAIRQILIETTSAQLLTMPIIMCLFGQFSVIALLANLLILPLIPFVMLLVFIAGIGTLVHIPFIGFSGLLAQFIMHWMIVVIEQLADISWASVNLTIPVSLAVAMYGIMAIFLVYIYKKTHFKLHGANVVE